MNACILKDQFVNSTICRKCQIILRYGSSWKRRILKREEIKEKVVHYAGKNTAPSDRVYVWGYAGTGALGMRTYMRPGKRQRAISRQMFPARMTFWDTHDLTVKSPACGYGFTVFIVKSRQRYMVYGTGLNTDSQIGYHEYPRKSGRILDAVIEPTMIDLPISAKSLIKQVACGRAHTLILTDQGVFSLGNNSYGQCGRPVIENEKYSGNPLIHKITSLPNNISQIVGGQDHSIFLTETGEVYSCGLGSDGQTGLGNYNVQGYPVKLEGDIQGERIIQVVGAADCMLAISEKHELFGWGNSEYSQLGDDQPQVPLPRYIPTACGRVIQVAAGGSSCSLLNDRGEVYVWGYGILGLGPQVDHTPHPTLIPPPLFGATELSPDSRVTSIAMGMNHFTALTDHGEVYVWGNNRHAALGLGHVKQQFFPLRVSVPAVVKSVSCGVDHMVCMAASFC